MLNIQNRFRSITVKNVKNKPGFMKNKHAQLMPGKENVSQKKYNKNNYSIHILFVIYFHFKKQPTHDSINQTQGRFRDRMSTQKADISTLSK